MTLNQSTIAFPDKNTWLVTGAAGFIGSNLCEYLLKNSQHVRAVDNFITGKKENIEDLKTSVGENIKNFSFIEGDIRDEKLCSEITSGVDYVTHQAAIGSVPRSIENPALYHSHNVDGHFSVLNASIKNKVKSFVYASSSSVYGDEPTLPKMESRIGKPLSPYAATKRINEVYTQVFSETYKVNCVGLRYFNVFGKRQDPLGMYAAVIPKWINQILKKEDVVIFGDGKTTRDFCYIDNVVQANVLSALNAPKLSFHEVFNVAFNQQITLNELYKLLVDTIGKSLGDIQFKDPIYKDFRAGDIRQSLADISNAQAKIGYAPKYSLSEGLTECIPWYISNFKK